MQREGKAKGTALAAKAAGTQGKRRCLSRKRQQKHKAKGGVLAAQAAETNWKRKAAAVFHLDNEFVHHFVRKGRHRRLQLLLFVLLNDDRVVNGGDKRR